MANFNYLCHECFYEFDERHDEVEIVFCPRCETSTVSLLGKASAGPYRTDVEPKQLEFDFDKKD